MNTSQTIHLKDTTEVVGYIAARTAETIAARGYPGHDLHTVMDRMTSDRVLETIRAAYVHWAAAGNDRPTGIVRIGVRLIAEYRRTFGLD